MLALLHTLLLALVAVAGWAVVRERNPVRQTLVLGFYAIVLAVQFMMVQAPDVALSQITAGGALVPLMLLLTLSKTRLRKPPEMHARGPNHR
ncbi:MAG: DUF4040 domain-containing protein [Bacteroidota bacterium]